MNKNKSLYAFTASATDFNRGKASILIKQVHDLKENLLIIKNSKPYAVIVSYDKFIELQSSTKADEHD